MPLRQEEHRRDDHERAESPPPSAVADDRRHVVELEILDPPAILDGARRIEVDLVRRQGGTEQAHHEVEVDREAAADVVAGHESVRHPAPVRLQLDRHDGEDQQPEAEVAEDALEPRERQHPDGRDEHQTRQGDQQPVGQPREQLEADRNAPDLGRARHEVDDLRGDQRRKPRAETRALPYEVEHRAIRDGRDPSAHLRVDDDPDDPDRRRPTAAESQTSRRPGC